MKKLILPIYFSAVLMLGLFAFDAYQSSKVPPMPPEVIDWLTKKNSKSYIGFVGRAQAQTSMRDYPLNNTPNTANDTLLGIDEQQDAGNWAVNNFTFSGILQWVQDNAFTIDLLGMADGEFRGSMFISGLNCQEALSKGNIVTLTVPAANPWILADADLGTKAMGIAAEDCTTGNPVKVMIQGAHRDDTYVVVPMGTELFMSPTAGEITSTVPSTTGQIIQVVGHRYPNNVVLYDFARPYMRVAAP